ncbi:hypothetical protein [Streptomyces olivochromogenes]|uniref:hypothetical protein n=1 Tax=Streptomyces olivochromogenes TaxID=1963 RepID=UPI001F371F82|nr:hypothetical protein [Streptomyces olivochromogenes]
MPITVSNADQNLTDACHTVAGDIARTDGKASLLLAFNGAALAGPVLGPRSSHRPAGH